VLGQGDAHHQSAVSELASELNSGSFKRAFNIVASNPLAFTVVFIQRLSQVHMETFMLARSIFPVMAIAVLLSMHGQSLAQSRTAYVC
jgi:hypothetical protein